MFNIICWKGLYLINFEWFKNNYLKANTGKSDILLTSDNVLRVNFESTLISNNDIAKLLGIIEPHVQSFI